MYIAVSGNIGSGKSTLTGMLAARYGLTPVYEAFEENPYLQDFYADMRRYSFHSQVFFLSRRLSQHLGTVNGAERVIQDRTVFEDHGVFARNLYQTGQMEAARLAHLRQPVRQHPARAPHARPADSHPRLVAGAAPADSAAWARL